MCNTHTLFIAKMKRVVFAILLLSLIQGVSGRSHCQLASLANPWLEPWCGQVQRIGKARTDAATIANAPKAGDSGASAVPSLGYVRRDSGSAEDKLLVQAAGFTPATTDF